MSSAVTLESPTPAQAGAAVALAEAQPDRVPVDQIIHGDCQRVLRSLPEASIDFVLTDPPYLVHFKDHRTKIQCK